MWTTSGVHFVSGKVLPRSSYVSALDIGTTKVCCLVAEETSRGLNIVGVGEARSEGLRRGAVVNMEKTVRGIAQAVQAAERVSGRKLESVCVGLSGTHLQSQNSRAVVAVSSSNHEIAREDVTMVVDAARMVAVPGDREIIHVVPRGYVVDGQEGVRDAVGMCGARLEVEAHIVTGSLTAVKNVVKCVQQADLNIVDLVVQSLASAEAVLSDNEVELGVALVDIGGGTTDIGLFRGGSILYTAVLPIGAMHVTSDIAIGLRTNLEEAERLKLDAGHTLPASIDREETLEIHQIGTNRVLAVPRRHLAEIIAPRANEILEMVGAELRNGSRDGIFPAGVVLTGGGARLAGILDTAEVVLDLPVRMGVPRGLTGMIDRIDGPAYATAIGLLRWGLRLRRQLDGQLPMGLGVGAVYHRTVRWFKDFF